MSNKAHFQTLFAYHAATYHNLLDCAAKLSEEAYKEDPGHGIGSIHDNLFHILYWHNRWRNGVETGKSGIGLRASRFTTLAALRAGIETEQAEWQRVIAMLSDAELEEDRSIDGSPFQLWRVLQHLIIHAMQHHSEIASQLTLKGESPGGIDFIWYNG